MNFDINFLNSISSFLTSALAILFAISIHEFGHAYVAHLNGDDTAKNMGRMTINPIDHIDPFGMLMMFLIHFGWAKPVPVNPSNYRNLRLGNITVSLAGIAFNLVSAIVFAIMSRFITSPLFSDIFVAMITYNIGFAAFNILPIPPLDGWNVLATFLPARIVEKMYAYSNYAYILFIVLMFSGKLTYILSPIYGLFLGLVRLFL